MTILLLLFFKIRYLCTNCEVLGYFNQGLKSQNEVHGYCRSMTYKGFLKQERHRQQVLWYLVLFFTGKK